VLFLDFCTQFDIDLTHEGVKNVTQNIIKDYLEADKHERQATGDNPPASGTDDLSRWTEEFAIRVGKVDKIIADTRKLIEERREAKALVQEDRHMVVLQNKEQNDE
ncbi:hypothetical protein RUND412_010644, partial [Rhizina undulata]